MTETKDVSLTQDAALIVVDLQNDFLPGGALAVPNGDDVISPLNEYVGRFSAESLPIVATRDWHPADHCSFQENGGIWPPHCIRETPGAAFAPGLNLPAGGTVISKADTREKDAYSGFEGSNLHDQLQALGIKTLFIGGLATDYCVLNTVRDALALGYATYLLTDASRAVDVKAGDGDRATAEMIEKGAIPLTLSNLGSLSE